MYLLYDNNLLKRAGKYLAPALTIQVHETEKNILH